MRAANKQEWGGLGVCIPLSPQRPHDRKQRFKHLFDSVSNRFQPPYTGLQTRCGKKTVPTHTLGMRDEQSPTEYGFKGVRTSEDPLHRVKFETGGLLTCDALGEGFKQQSVNTEVENLAPCFSRNLFIAEERRFKQVTNRWVA